MVSLTATLFKGIVNDVTIANEDAEKLIDLAISQINLYSKADLPLSSGTSGSKSVSLESEEYAAVFDALRAIYYGCYKGIQTTSVAGMTVTSADLMSNPAVIEKIKEAARRIAEFDVSYG